jgi:hypothetical protein
MFHVVAHAVDSATKLVIIDALPDDSSEDSSEKSEVLKAAHDFFLHNPKTQIQHPFGDEVSPLQPLP